VRTLVLVRHGATAWNERGLCLGRRDLALSAAGREQAERLAEALSGESFDRVFSSPLLRARETAQLLGRETELLADLLEIDRGEWEGLAEDEIRRRYPDLRARWYDDPEGLAMPGGESFAALWERAGRALERLGAGERVLAVGHKAINRVVIARALGRSSKGVWGIAQPQAGRTVLEADGGPWRVVLLGDTSHLPSALRSET
jgi:broad specificity phosphatase PhoE